jgi:hypothetical protein
MNLRDISDDDLSLEHLGDLHVTVKEYFLYIFGRFSVVTKPVYVPSQRATIIKKQRVID